MFYYLQKGLSNDDVGVARGTVHRRYGQKLVSKPAISSEKSWVGYRRTTWSGSWCLATLFSSAGTQTESFSLSAKPMHLLSGGVGRSGGFACGVHSMTLGGGTGLR